LFQFKSQNATGKFDEKGGVLINWLIIRL